MYGDKNDAPAIPEVRANPGSQSSPQDEEEAAGQFPMCLALQEQIQDRRELRE